MRLSDALTFICLSVGTTFDISACKQIALESRTFFLQTAVSRQQQTHFSRRTQCKRKSTNFHRLILSDFKLLHVTCKSHQSRGCCAGDKFATANASRKPLFARSFFGLLVFFCKLRFRDLQRNIASFQNVSIVLEASESVFCVQKSVAASTLARLSSHCATAARAQFSVYVLLAKLGKRASRVRATSGDRTSARRKETQKAR